MGWLCPLAHLYEPLLVLLLPQSLQPRLLKLAAAHRLLIPDELLLLGLLLGQQGLQAVHGRCVRERATAAIPASSALSLLAAG